ncbi:MAG: TonB-dependent receptor, partial [Bacteroidales bacterium]|nr:TonB-dependent receptor [Bacteroidales bacterium]
WGYWPEDVNNPDLHWEKTTQYDIGLDLGILNQKVNFTTDFYLKNTTDLLFEKELPDYNGGGTVWTNQGRVLNKGMEFTLNVYPVQTKDLSWESNLTASYTDNVVKNLGGVDYLIPDASRGGMYQGGIFILKVGKPVGSFYLQDWAGFDDAGANLYRTTDGGVTTENNTGNRILIGHSIPKWTFGWNNTLTYKNWDLNIFFRATGKYDRLDLSRYIESCMVGASRFISTREAYYLSWDKVADKKKARFPSLTNSSNQYVAGSTEWLENAAFIRCQNLTIGYSVPQTLTKVVKIHLALSAENLFVLTKYKGMDPETVSEVKDTYQDTTFGMDDGSFPIPRTYSFMMRFEF